MSLGALRDGCRERAISPTCRVRAMLGSRMAQVEACRIYLGARKARAKGDPGMILRALALAVMVLGSGCVVDGLDEPRTEEAQQSVLLCDGWLCGTNSPQIAEFGFWQLHMPPVLGTAGLPNNVGLQ